MKKILLFLMSLFSLSAISATAPKQAFAMAQSGKAVIIDVREAEELAPGMIQGAKWFPLSQMENDKNWKEDFVKLAEGRTIFLHCRSGKRSEKAKEILKKNGIAAENIGGYEDLKKILPIKKP